MLNLLQEEPNGVALLPQPFVEVAKPLVDKLNVPINIMQAWNELNLSTGAESVTTVTVVRKAFREQHEQAVQEYLQARKAVHGLHARERRAGHRAPSLGRR